MSSLEPDSWLMTFTAGCCACTNLNTLLVQRLQRLAAAFKILVHVALHENPAEGHPELSHAVSVTASSRVITTVLHCHNANRVAKSTHEPAVPIYKAH